MQGVHLELSKQSSLFHISSSKQPTTGKQAVASCACGWAELWSNGAFEGDSAVSFCCSLWQAVRVGRLNCGAPGVSRVNIGFSLALHQTSTTCPLLNGQRSTARNLLPIWRVYRPLGLLGWAMLFFKGGLQRFHFFESVSLWSPSPKAAKFARLFASCALFRRMPSTVSD